MASDETPNLRLPYLMAAQAQKHVTHNEGLRALDAIVQLSVLDRDLGTPPPSPAEGDRYIVGASPTGAWAGHSGCIAAWQDGAWMLHAPREGWLGWIEDEGRLAAYDGAAWIDFTATLLNPADLVGVNTTADATNRLAVSSPATLFSHAGGSHHHKINKNAAGDTASVLFQTGFSGRAEMGTSGDDNWHLKVSGDGASWKEALVVDRGTGAVSIPLTPASVVRRTFLASATWTKPAGLKKVHVWGCGGGAGSPDMTAAASQIALSGGASCGTFGFKAIDAASLGATESVTIGAAGSAASTAGGTTSFGAHMTLPGGGTPATITSGTSPSTTGVGTLPAAATGADWSVRGSYGSTRGRRSSGTDGLAGSGASGLLGNGGVGAGPGGAAIAALGYGAGAGGACANSATTVSGAAGAPGILFVEEYY